jgi:hypothetical protein
MCFLMAASAFLTVTAAKSKRNVSVMGYYLPCWESPPMPWCASLRRRKRGESPQPSTVQVLRFVASSRWPRLWKSVAQHVPFYLVPTKAAKGSYTSSHAQVAMLILPTLCTDCNEPTMEVVEHRPNDSYEARCAACGCRSLGKIAPELLIVKCDIDSDQ